MTAPRAPLSEKDFINEGYSKDPYPLWLWFFFLIAFLSVIWAGGNWYNSKLNMLLDDSPYLQVTNRQISLFLWQNPEFMRINAKEKNAYLPGFKYLDKVTLNLSDADHYAIGSPELFFRYHTWDRLLKDEFTQRSIPKKEFIDFLSYAEEWYPVNWLEASQEYISLVDHLSSLQTEDLSTLSLQAMPMEVRMAFQGWKNYFLDGEAINRLQPTYQQIQKFLVGHPHYARNYWRNIVARHTPDFLKGLSSGLLNADALVPVDELDSFLKVVIYNFIMAQKESKDKSTQDKPAKPIEAHK